MTLLAVRNLTITDTRTKDVIIDNISFTLERNSCLGIVGESGSGKSMTVKGLLGLTPPWLHVTGTSDFDHVDLLQLKDTALRNIRGRRICMILQDAMSAFNPLYTIGKQMRETLSVNLGYSKQEAEETFKAELIKMAITEPDIVMKKYPHQLSGGMLQRCMIAIATAIKPEIIIADEPTTALDSINQREVIAEFQRLRKDLGIAVIFISHDLGVIQQLAQSVLVLKDGKHIEYGNVDDVFLRPKQAYTKYLIETRVQLTRAFSEALGKDNVKCSK